MRISGKSHKIPCTEKTNNQIGVLRLNERTYQYAITIDSAQWTASVLSETKYSERRRQWKHDTTLLRLKNAPFTCWLKQRATIYHTAHCLGWFDCRRVWNADSQQWICGKNHCESEFVSYGWNILKSLQYCWLQHRAEKAQQARKIYTRSALQYNGFVLLRIDYGSWS